MTHNNAVLRGSIQSALAAFQKKPLSEAATGLLAMLGYRSDRTVNSFE